MKIGDLVTVKPAKTGLYLVIGKKSKNIAILYGKINGDYLSMPMGIKWIETINKGR